MVDIGKSTAGKKLLDYTDEGLGFRLNLASNHEAALAEFLESASRSVGQPFFMGASCASCPFLGDV